mgnify:CR=1 FL=1
MTRSREESDNDKGGMRKKEGMSSKSKYSAAIKMTAIILNLSESLKMKSQR